MSDRQMRWLIVGEQHGTAETPVIFSDLLCVAAASRRRVVAALEYPVADQARIDAFLASDGRAEARAALLAAEIWHRPMQDGRASQAFLALFERLRQMRTSGAIAGVVAFQPSGLREPAAYERAMAQVVERASPNSKTLVVALVGNVHARTSPWSRGPQSYMPMAGWLPRAQTRTLNPIGNGGALWACFRDPASPAGGPPVCTARNFGPTPQPHERGIVLTPEPGATYSGSLYLGVPTTASPPAAAH